MNLCCVNTAEKVRSDYEKQINKLKNEIRTETTLRLDAETRIKTLESAMQEFVDDIETQQRTTIGFTIEDATCHKIQFKQLLENHD